MLLDKAQEISACLNQLKSPIASYNRYPMRSYSSYANSFSLDRLVFEIGNIFRYYLDGNNMFNPSLCLSFYHDSKHESFSYYRFFIQGLTFRKEDLPPLVEKYLAKLISAGLVTEKEGKFSAKYRVILFEDLFFVTDQYSQDEDMVWLSTDSLNTASRLKAVLKLQEVLSRASSDWKVLDLCCGSGLVGTYSAKLISAAEGNLSGLDINPKACDQAALNCMLNGLGKGEFKTASVYDYIYNEKFDLIVSNPAYGSSPYEAERTCHFGGESGIEQTLAVFDHIVRSLSQDGFFFVTADSPIIEGKSLLLGKLEEDYQDKLSITYENALSYSSKGGKLQSDSSSDLSINERQRVFIYGSLSSGSAGKLRVKNNALYSWYRQF